MLRDTHAETTVAVSDEVVAGPKAYAIGIDGDVLSPELLDGEFGVFDPDASPVCGDIVAVWWKDRETPSVVKLHLGVPPAELWDLNGELSTALFAGGASPRSARTAPMSKVRAVHKMVGKGRPEMGT